jgi:hypothetical protein
MRPSNPASSLILCLACLLVGTLQISLGYGQEPEASLVVLRGATLIDGLGNPPLANATVVVEGDRIQSIFSGQDRDTPAGATLIDVTGKFVIPGLVDTHVHWDVWMGEVYINHGVTSILAMADVSKEERTHSLTSLSTPRVFHAGGRPRLSLSMTREEVHQAIREHLEKEPDIAWFVQFRESNRQMYGWAAEEAHAVGLAVFSHDVRPGTGGLRNGPVCALGGLP